MKREIQKKGNSKGCSCIMIYISRHLLCIKLTGTYPVTQLADETRPAESCLKRNIFPRSLLSSKDKDNGRQSHHPRDLSSVYYQRSGVQI